MLVESVRVGRQEHGRGPVSGEFAEYAAAIRARGATFTAKFYLGKLCTEYAAAIRAQGAIPDGH